MKKSTKKTPFYKTGTVDPSPKAKQPKVKQPKAKAGEVPGLQEIRDRFKGKYEVYPKKGKANKYTLRDSKGNSVSYSAGPKVKRDNTTLAQAINKSME